MLRLPRENQHWGSQRCQRARARGSPPAALDTRDEGKHEDEEQVEVGARTCHHDEQRRVFREVRGVCRIGTTDRVAILYEGRQPDVRRWTAMLDDAGYAADALEAAGSSLEAA